MRLQPNASGEVWLNVGSGHVYEHGFVNLDNHPFLRASRLYPALQHVLRGPRWARIRDYHEATQRAAFVHYDCRQPLPLNAEVDHILCSHFLEHVYPDVARRIVAGFARALRPGGTLHVIVPDLGDIVRRYQAGGSGDQLMLDTAMTRPSSPSWRYRLLELLGQDGLQHRWLYDARSLQALVRGAGFELLAANETPSAHVRSEGDGCVSVVARRPVSVAAATTARVEHHYPTVGA